MYKDERSSLSSTFPQEMLGLRFTSLIKTISMQYNDHVKNIWNVMLVNSYKNNNYNTGRKLFTTINSFYSYSAM